MSKTLYPNSIRIGLMDPSIAQTWAQRILSDGTTVGSIKKGDTINHTTSQPIATGLFCQRIFGPCTDYTCACGHEKIRVGFNPNIAPPVCSECHVEWTHASVRRQFLGSIDLISPVTHKWFSDSRGAYIPTLLGITPRTFRNLKECKLFFPFGLQKKEELLQYSKQKKKINAYTLAEPAPVLDSKEVTSTFRAMHTLQFLVDPEKSKNPWLAKLVKQEGPNLFQEKDKPLTNNRRGFWFLSNKLLESGNISLENLFSKFSDVCMVAGATYFPSTVLSTSGTRLASSKYNIATKTFGEDISSYNPKNSTNKIFSNLQTKTPKFLGKKKSSSKDKNFYSLIATTQWLTSEQVLSNKEKITELFSKKLKKPYKNLFSSKKDLKKNFYKDQENTNQFLKLKQKQGLVKKQSFSFLDSYASDFNSSNAKPNEATEYKPSKARKTLEVGPSQGSQIESIKNPMGKPIKNWNLKNDDIIFNWKAKSLLNETNIEYKTISANKSKATLGLARQAWRAKLAQETQEGQHNHFLKKENLKYVFVLAQKMKNNEKITSIFSENFSILALQNKQAFLNYELQSKAMLNNKEKKTVLASFFENVRKIKSQSKTRVSPSEIGINPFLLMGRNGTYLFRDFTKYQFKESLPILFGKNEKATQLFTQDNTNRTKFGSKIYKFQTISNYKLGLLGNSKVGLCMTLNPFSFNLLLPQKTTWSIAETTFKRLFRQSTNKWLLNKDKERLFSYFQCTSLLRITGTKLWYLKQKKTLANFLLETSFYGFKTVKSSVQENLKETRCFPNKTTNNLLAFNLKFIFQKSTYLRNLLSNKALKQLKKDKSSFLVQGIVLKNSNAFAKHHNFPTRPSYTQPEDYRRQFIKFLGYNSSRDNKDVPIFRYIKASSLTKKGQIIKNLVKQPFTQKSTASLLSPQAIEVYFSEAKSVAKEQTIKKILSQTGGGGLQTYLELVNLSELVLILQNDLSEIAPRLSKSQSTRRVLLSIINEASNSLTETLFLLKKSRQNTNSLSAKPRSLTLLTLQEGAQKAQPQKEEQSTSSPLLKNKDSVKSELADFNLSTSTPNTPNTPNTKETYYPNQFLLSEKIEILEKKCKDVKKEYKAVKKICSDFQNRKNAHKRRYKLAFQLLRTMSNPAGMTMSSVPVLPPGLRPIIDVPKIGPITADLNIRYRSLLFALRNLRELAYVDFRNAGAAQASVQEAVDDLLYTGGKTRREKSSSQNPNLYKSLAMRLKGKHGRFRGNLLGKRVDYSGRSVIVVGPTLKIHQCGLPFEIAIKLFNPFLIRSLIQRGFCKNVYKAKQILIRGKFKPLIWTLCQEVMSEHLVLLNRAPTLHRLGVQAFMPVLISGRAILLHPLVCTGFNADFDGDQMGVHVPLFPQARAEAWKMMWSRNNFLLPSSGEPVLLPSQDMVLGCYYLTCSTQKVFQTRIETPKCNDSFSFPFTILNTKTALNGYKKGTYNIQSIIWINLNKTTYLKSGGIYQRYYKKNISLKSWNPEIQKTEGDGLVTSTLELRITPFGRMRLLYTGGIKSFTFQNSLLLPGRQTIKPPAFAIFVRTTIGRLIFNNLLADIGLS